MAVRLFVGNLPYDVTEAEVRTHFAAVGPLSFLALPMDRATGKPRGFAFVEFRDQADAEEAMRRFNNQEFQGRLLAVHEARARDDHAAPSPPRPFPPRPAVMAPPSSVGETRNFGPDAAPRRRRKAPKGAVKAERGPKRPMYKRTGGPVRFSTDDDDSDAEDNNAPHSAHRRANVGDHDTA